MICIAILSYLFLVYVCLGLSNFVITVVVDGNAAASIALPPLASFSLPSAANIAEQPRTGFSSPAANIAQQPLTSFSSPCTTNIALLPLTGFTWRFAANIVLPSPHIMQSSQSFILLPASQKRHAVGPASTSSRYYTRRRIRLIKQLKVAL